jgi:hypothetical protein
LLWEPGTLNTAYNKLPYSCIFTATYANNPYVINYRNEVYQSNPYFYITNQNKTQFDSGYGYLIIFTVAGEYDIDLTVSDVFCVPLMNPPDCNTTGYGCYYTADPSCPTITTIQPPTLSLYLNGILVSRNQSLRLSYTNSYNVGDYITMSIMNNDTYTTIQNITGTMDISVKNP